MSRDTTKYGDKYWCVKVPLHITKAKEVYVCANTVRVTEAGVLVFEGKQGDVNLAFAPGSWLAVYAASVLDGHAVAVDHWIGEVIEE